MVITENNKTRILALLKIAVEQNQSIESVSIQVNDQFNIEAFIPYLLNDRWPYAVDPLLIADPNSEDDKISRAHGILSIVVTEPINGKFLDFGCGEGHVVSEVAKKAPLAFGYDIVKHDSWDRFNPVSNQFFSNVWHKVVDKGPYDTVLIYDVLDHLKDEAEVVKELKNIRSVLSDKGKVFVRCHPFCSRHGTHLYQSVNRAYLHLCLDNEALDKLGYKYLHTIKIIHPLQTYKSWFDQSGFNQTYWNIVPENVEPFFQQPAIASLIKKNWRTSGEEALSSGKSFPEWQMKQQFVDYVLEKA